MRKPLARVFGEHRSSDRSIAILELDSYRDYLKSPQWKAIRSAVLSDRPQCEICDNEATQVHHHSYDSVVMAGGMNDLLVSLCRDCHELVEFDGDRKLDHRDVMGKLKRLLIDSGHGQVAKRLRRGERLLRAAGRASRHSSEKPPKRGRCALAFSPGKRPRPKSKRRMIYDSIPECLRDKRRPQ